ncbi:uncharacterized protein LOC109838043 isoform X2 [Asparagus officinalis]|uniref:uncharacterized protein LOC109838043 isoform X2 n=1 Tax=Asparagus officinalis TaxID=4686 RepID=UPI00098DFC1E|nr:uncharacterized protein LOC109838043 isoform X2 [Asparagus officinalis]
MEIQLDLHLSFRVFITPLQSDDFPGEDEVGSSSAAAADDVDDDLFGDEHEAMDYGGSQNSVQCGLLSGPNSQSYFVHFVRGSSDSPSRYPFYGYIDVLDVPIQPFLVDCLLEVFDIEKSNFKIGGKWTYFGVEDVGWITGLSMGGSIIDTRSIEVIVRQSINMSFHLGQRQKLRRMGSVGLEEERKKI